MKLNQKNTRRDLSSDQSPKKDDFKGAFTKATERVWLSVGALSRCHPRCWDQLWTHKCLSPVLVSPFHFTPSFSQPCQLGKTFPEAGAPCTSVCALWERRHRATRVTHTPQSALCFLDHCGNSVGSLGENKGSILDCLMLCGLKKKKKSKKATTLEMENLGERSGLIYTSMTDWI